MSSTPLRSGCPINASLELFGDKWSLLILRDMMYFRKKSFSEFLASDEGIARNILIARLKQLQAQGIVVKQDDASDSRKHHYEITDAGLDLFPILLTLANWGRAHVTSDESTDPWFKAVRSRREEIEELVRSTVRNGAAVFVDGADGQPSVIRQLGLI